MTSENYLNNITVTSDLKYEGRKPGAGRRPEPRPESPFQDYVDSLVVGSGIGKVFYIDGPAQMYDIKNNDGTVLMPGNPLLRKIRAQLTDAANTRNERKDAEQITVRMPFSDNGDGTVKVKFYAIPQMVRHPKPKTTTAE